MNRDFECTYRVIDLVTNSILQEYKTWWHAVDAYLDLREDSNCAIFNIRQPGYFKLSPEGDLINYITGEVGSTGKEIFLHIAEQVYDAAH